MTCFKKSALRRGAFFIGENVARNFVLIFFMFWVIGCNPSNSVKPKEIDKFYKMRMKIDNMGKVNYGFAVLENKPLYTFEFTSLGKMDYFSFNSCSTNISRVSAGGYIFKRKTTKVNFRPNEIEKGCDVRIDSTSIKGAKFTSGYVLFLDDKYKLEGVLICGSKTNVHDGVSACQNYHENKIRIKFQEPSRMYSETCKINRETKKEFTISTELGFCNYIFSGQLSKHRHRLVTRGYNDDLLI